MAPMPVKTDWDSYYSRPAAPAAITRRITAARLVKAFRDYAPSTATIFEFGGANSCFFSTMRKELAPRSYFILDNNRTGLDAFRANHPDATEATLIEADVLRFTASPVKADVVYSVGLIEHFNPEQTAEAIRAHFRAVRSGGLVLITFPTPTWLYRLIRGALELFGLWRFPDERPLGFAEVAETVKSQGEILHQSVNWPILLTQGIIAARAR